MNRGRLWCSRHGKMVTREDVSTGQGWAIFSVSSVGSRWDRHRAAASAALARARHDICVFGAFLVVTAPDSAEAGVAPSRLQVSEAPDASTAKTDRRIIPSTWCHRPVGFRRDSRSRTMPTDSNASLHVLAPRRIVRGCARRPESCASSAYGFCELFTVLRCTFASSWQLTERVRVAARDVPNTHRMLTASSSSVEIIDFEAGGSSGWIRTSNPPVNRFTQVGSRVASSWV